MNIEDKKLLDACRVPKSLAPKEFGIWAIDRYPKKAFKNHHLAGYPDVTLLRRYTESNIHEGGEVVMEDSKNELKKHLPFLRVAYGNILISGLGLGCVVRGLLSRSAVKHIDVIEIDKGIIKHIGSEFMNNKRVTLFHADALTKQWPKKKKWDFAWHDIHQMKKTQPHIHALHVKLVAKYSLTCAVQGAWGMSETIKTKIRKIGFKII